MHISSLSDITELIAIVTFVGSIVIYLFKKIVIEPLTKSIDDFNETLKEFKDSTEKRLDFIEKRVDVLEDHDSRYQERLKTIFLKIGGEKHE